MVLHVCFLWEKASKRIPRWILRDLKCRYDRFRTKLVSDFSGEENNWENWVIQILQKGHEWALSASKMREAKKNNDLDLFRPCWS